VNHFCSAGKFLKVIAKTQKQQQRKPLEKSKEFQCLHLRMEEEEKKEYIAMGSSLRNKVFFCERMWKKNTHTHTHVLVGK
jgi:hypothetical protein